MSIDSVDTFLAILQRAQVLTPQEVKDVARELGPHFTDPHELARYLAEIDWLTAYQVRLLFSDRWEELTIGPYLILDRLGEGGVSEVFKAWDTVKGRPVALKVLHQHLTNCSAAVRELQRELQAVTRLSHPNIIRTFDAHQVGEVSYFAMEFVEGLDLERYVRRCGQLSIADACEYIRQAAQGLQHAHQLGLAHRDIKPANLFLSIPNRAWVGETMSLCRAGDPVIRILDWGLARVRPDAGGAADPASLDLDAEKGVLIGTADYIAPEQARDPCLVDIRADIYSLGCTLYFLLTGQAPFRGGSLMQKLLQHQDAERPNVREIRADVPEELADIVKRMLARRPEDRYAIPLLAAAALRPFAATTAKQPSSSTRIVRPKKPSTALIDLSAHASSEPEV
ncbi:MAG TPA: serine/threonine-protein kinase [Gemmataceae bacterium]|jgi:serine/threonine-protein kinase